MASRSLPVGYVVYLEGSTSNSNDSISNHASSDLSGPARDTSGSSQVATINAYGEGESADGRHMGSSTFSLPSSQENLFQERHGRTYHSFSAHRDYLLPNDEPERDRMDMLFWAIHEVLGSRCFHAPISDNPQNIVDIGTGTGLWAIEVAAMYPDAQVTGTDLSPMQPTWVPPNVTFELHDCLQYPWEFSRRFDFIHTQLLNGLVVKDWHEFYKECFHNLSKGGWVESHEVNIIVQSDDDSIPKNSAIIRWLNLWIEGAGRGFRMTGDELGDTMKRIGFVDIAVKKIKLPIGVWDTKHLNAGMLNLTSTIENMEGLSMRVFKDNLGMTEQEMKSYIEPAVKEWMKKDFHSYWNLYVVYGRKP